jgi:hypothetical protein
MTAFQRVSSPLVICVFSCTIMCSCGGTSKPVTTGVQNYDVQKTMSPSCGASVECIDFVGTGDFETSQASCPSTPSAGTQGVTFMFDSASYIDLDIATSPLLPNQVVNVQFTDTDANGGNIEGPWTLSLGSATGGSHWSFHFAVGSPLSLTSGKPILGHYVAEALGAFNMTAPLITIHAQNTVSGTPPLATIRCSAN